MLKALAQKHNTVYQSYPGKVWRRVVLEELEAGRSIDLHAKDLCTKLPLPETKVKISWLLWARGSFIAQQQGGPLLTRGGAPQKEVLNDAWA